MRLSALSWLRVREWVLLAVRTAVVRAEQASWVALRSPVRRGDAVI
ncbi:hypothetical protein [Streptomyces sp. NPDC001123]